MITCNLDGKLSWQPEQDGQPASVGKICAWGGFTIAEISEEVPLGERNEYAMKFAMVDELITALKDAQGIIEGDANTEENYDSLCRIGSVLGRLEARHD